NAGGSPNEMLLYYNPSFNGISRLVSPAIDLTGVSEVVFMFKHCLDNYSGSHTLGIATSSDNGTTWNSGWSQSYSNDGVYTVAQTITTADMGSANVLFCVYYQGNSYNIDNWYFDDITVFTQTDLDLGITSINAPALIGAGDIVVDFSIYNYGLNEITQIEASYQFTGHSLVTETFNLNLATLTSTSLQFAVPQNLLPGTYDLTVNVSLVNGTEDDDITNNSSEMTVGVAYGSAQNIPMIEHFSSSTCGPCVAVNTAMLTLTNNNPGHYTYTKYPMSWPGTGDPYYTSEGGIRRSYYGVSAVPQTFLGGQDQGYAAVSQAALNSQYNSPAFADVRGSFTMNGSTINIKADVMSFVAMESAVIYISVNEKTTTQNTGSNGETSFHHIMMKMLPDANGSTVAFDAGEIVTLEFSYDMSQTHVEELDDLEVSVWLQNYTSQEIFNSHFMYEYTANHPDVPVNVVLSDNANGTATLSWDAPNDYVVSYGVLANDGTEEIVSNTTLSYDFNFTGDFLIAQVYAIYADEQTSVNVLRSIDAPVECDPITNLTGEQVFAKGADDYVATITLSWDAPATNPQSYNIYAAGELIGNTTETTYQFGYEVAGDDPATVNVCVTAVYASCESDQTCVNVNVVYVGIEEITADYAVYPNPADDIVYVNGENISSIMIYNSLGQMIMKVDNTNSVVTSSLKAGIYYFNVVANNETVARQKLVIAR
ncbi:MAG: T9SS type A sorting domain-containing protein, partial [Bacteroidales bacterium]|nr:T9SS type A sorting domain-containing protein [Bacteroidales bacterium]